MEMRQRRRTWVWTGEETGDCVITSLRHAAEGKTEKPQTLEWHVKSISYRYIHPTCYSLDAILQYWRHWNKKATLSKKV